mgnify:CR=1 FL=1
MVATARRVGEAGAELGPRGLPVVGALRELARDALGFVSDTARVYGDVVPFSVGRAQAWLVSHPDDLEDLLVRQRDHLMKDVITAELSSVLGQGLLTNEGASWKRQRRIIAPSFTPRHLAAYGDAMVQSTLEALPPVSDDRDVHADFTRMTLHIVLRTLFGSEPGGEAARVGDVLEGLMASFEVENRTVWRLVPDWVPGAHRRRVDTLREELDTLIFGLVARARREGTDGRVDLLARLLAARDDDGHAMSDEQLRDELLTLFLAGHETTALALSYTLWLLAEHPEVLAQVHDELDEVLAGALPVAGDTRRLPVLMSVVKESLRLYPPAWAMGRQASAPVQVGEQVIPAGDQITVAPWVVHRDPRWWVGPSRFRPARWRNGETADLPRFAYFPFGGGERVCVGQHFAMMEIVLVLATLLQKRSVRAVPGYQPELFPVVTLRVKNGVRVGLTEVSR